MATLEAQLTALMQEFVGRLVDLIRNASFAEVASLSVPRAPAARQSPGPKRAAAAAAPSSNGRGRTRQTAASRAELGERVVQALRDAAQPLGVRALATELGIPADKLA